MNKRFKNIDTVEKIIFANLGIIGGMFPPKVQTTLCGGDDKGYDRASIMSTSSRLVNLVSSVVPIMSYAIESIFDVPISTPAVFVSNPFYWGLVADTVVREGARMLDYGLEGGSYYVDFFGPWGSPTLTFPFNYVENSGFKSSEKKL